MTSATSTMQDTVPAGSLEDGRVVAIAGPVIDVEFPPTRSPRSTMRSSSPSSSTDLPTS